MKSLNAEALAGSTSLSDVLLSRVQFEALDREENAVNIRLSATVVRVEHETDKSVSITYVDNGKLYRVRGKNTVMASGGWVNRRVLRDLPDAHRGAYESFRHSSVLIANVALTNWRFLAKLGIAACLYEGGFGFSCNIRRPMILGDAKASMNPDQPIVLTFYVPYFYPGLSAKGQGEAGRLELLTASFASIETRLREQMSLLFADGGLDPTRDIAGIILNRWGHAYTNPEPGFMFGLDGAEPVPDVIREPVRPHRHRPFGAPWPPELDRRCRRRPPRRGGAARHLVESLRLAYACCSNCSCMRAPCARSHSFRAKAPGTDLEVADSPEVDMRTWTQHGSYLLLLGIPAGMGLAVSIQRMLTASDWEIIVWIALSIILVCGYAGTAILSTILFPFFRDISSRAALPLLYVSSALVASGLSWLWLTA